jgi:hypothetical protein
MTNEYVEYYLNQSGSGISGFSGLRYQKGNSWKGFFKFIRPVLAYFTKQGIKTAANIGADLLEGENLKTSAKNRFIETGKSVGKKAVEKLNTLSDQIGNGKIRKYTKRNKSYWSIKKKPIRTFKKRTKRNIVRKNYKKPVIEKMSRKRKRTVKENINKPNKKRKTILSGSVPFPY